MKQKWWILLTLLLCGCGASSQPDQTGAVQNDRPRLSASMEETAENVAAVEKNENLEKNPSNSNQNPGEGQNWTVFAMDTVMQFDAYGGSANLQEKVKRRVEELEGELSTTQENSDIFHLNQEKTAELSADTRYLMQEALALGAETDGALYRNDSTKQFVKNLITEEKLKERNSVLIQSRGNLRFFSIHNK